MTEISRQAARMVGIGFSGTTIPSETRELISRDVCAVIFFSRNVESAQQFAELAADVKSLGAEKILTCVDQEGGRVMRLREPFTVIPSMRALGQANDPELTGAVGRILARELRAINIDQNLAPVLDVDTNPDNPVIAARSFGRTPEQVARMGVALIRGLQENGVAACGKHFPGHGDTSSDSHLDLPRLDHPMTRLMSIEVPPFQAAIRAGVASIMTAHIVFTSIDPTNPATMSHMLLEGLLRRQLGFDGVLMSDDMQMKAIADHYGFDEAIVRGASAGVDLFWICHDHALQNRAIETLIKAVESGEMPRERVEQANRRLDALFSRYVQTPTRGPMPELVGCEEHQAIVRRLHERVGPDVVRGGDFDPTEQLL